MKSGKRIGWIELLVLFNDSFKGAWIIYVAYAILKLYSLYFIFLISGYYYSIFQVLTIDGGMVM